MERGQIRRLKQMAYDLECDIGRSVVKEPQASARRKKMRSDLEALTEAIRIVELAKKELTP